MKERTYVVGTSPKGRLTITLNQCLEDIPFNVWRDVFRLAGSSHSNGIDNETFEFLNPKNLPKAKEVLEGAMYHELFKL